MADALIVTPSVAAYFVPLMPDMLRFYHDEGSKMLDEELLISLDHHFGDRMVREICEPLGFFQGACAFIATVLLRQEDQRHLIA